MRRPASQTSVPPLARLFARANPIPLEAPVTSAVLARWFMLGSIRR
jgi:hypothetical protein